jgi:hypothetical protein
MDIEVGDNIKLMGKSFKVQTCYEERGNKDDITAWIYLAEAQELLHRKGKINAILALECHCTVGVLHVIRKEIAAFLPNTQVIERGSRAIARAETRTKVEEQARLAVEKEKNARAELRAVREHLASIPTPVVVTACAIWVDIWLTLTVAFEFLFGHYVAKLSWRRLLHDYNLFAGRLWLFVLVAITVAPSVIYRIRS